MPTVDVSYQDLCRLIGKHIPLNKLKDEGILFAKGEIEEVRGDMLKIDVKDTNRPDLWSTEGIAREKLLSKISAAKSAVRSVGLRTRLGKLAKDLRLLRDYTPEVVEAKIAEKVNDAIMHELEKRIEALSP